MSSADDNASGSGSGRFPFGVVPGLVALESRHVDEAAESAINDTELPETSANVIRNLMAVDTNSPVAQAYFEYYNARGTARLRTRMRKAVINIDYFLTDSQITALVDYAPEYELVFRNLQLHDHPMAAAMRMLDHNIINSRIPALASVTDVGGDALYHIRNGHVNVHCCDPIEDVKDETRRTIRDLTAKTMLEEERYSTGESKIMLESYFSGEDKHFCKKRAQDCRVRGDVITSIHVYDVPMAEWPRIMENKGANVVEGALIFSNRFFDDRVGELTTSGVRYEIDVDKDVFKMGFVDSPSWWYHHKWSELIRYGVDQNIVYGDNVYAYKVVERRHDTIYFRILAVNSALQRKPYWKDKVVFDYVYPSVRMVEVEGFEFNSADLRQTRSRLVRKKFSVAVPLWEALVNTAELDFERGVLDFQKMFNAYRTIAPKHTINGVVISGGYSVQPDDLGLVVIHASIIGAMRSTLSDMTNRSMTREVMEVRNKKVESTAKKVGVAILDACRIGCYPLAKVTGISYLGEAFNNYLDNAMLNNFVKVNATPIIRSVPVDTIFVRRGRSEVVSAKPEDGNSFTNLSADSILHDIVDSAVNNHELAQHLLDTMGETLGESNRRKLNKAVLKAKETKAREKKNKVTETSTHERPPLDGNWSSIALKRRAAIQEAIVEIMQENDITLSVCKRMYSQFVPGNLSVNVLAVQRDQEANGNPDLWKVINGVLASSSVVNRIPVRDYAYSVAYSPDPFDDGSHFVKVDRHEWFNDVSGETEVNYIVSKPNFCGYLLVCDALIVYNGEPILKALKSAIQLPHDYTVTLNEGPPGCGKTHAIIHEYKESDVVLCPVRESSQDTYQRLVTMYPGKERTLKDVVRTVDSFLIHGFRSNTNSNKLSRILADECFMTHAGKWYAVAALLGVTEIWAYGDTKQIPHIPRVQVPKFHVRLEYDVRVFNPVTRRCPADSVSAWTHLYDNLIRSTNTITDSMRETSNFRGIVVTADTCLMGMYQADKKEIRRLFPDHDKSKKGPRLIVTAHEAEGKTYKHVVLFRFDRRRRKDKLSLYDQEPYALVATSRHTDSFLYVRADGLGDLVSAMITSSRNPRRIQAILDVDKAGERYE